MEEQELLAYVSGMMDGDGSFSITKCKPSMEKQSSLYKPLIQFGSVDESSVTIMKELFGGCIHRRAPKTGNDGISRKEFFFWYLGGLERVKKALSRIAKYLVIKRERCELILDYIDKHPFKRGSNKLLSNELEEREKYYIKIRNLNSSRTMDTQIHKSSRSLNNDPIFLSYFSGLIDTDGSFCIKKEKPRTKSPLYAPILCISITDAKGINKIVDNCPFGTVTLIKAKSCKIGSCYRWAIHSKKELVELLPFIIPFLRIKRKQAEIMLEFCNKFNSTKYRNAGIPDTELEFREKCHTDIIKLNQCGVYKPSLIDSEAQERGDEGEDESHAERLSERDSKECATV